MQVGSTFWFICAITTAFAVASVSEEDEEMDEGISSTRASCNFTLTLLKHVSTKYSTSNIIFSPASISIVLSVLQQGAKGNTAAQLEKLLLLPPEKSLEAYKKLTSLMDQKEVSLEWGNRCYIKPGFPLVESFKETAKEGFNVEFEEMNFGVPSTQDSASIINKWVKEVTHDKIKDLVEPSMLSPDTVMVLINAIFFKGTWFKLFKKAKTAEGKFELTTDNSLQTLFMTQRDKFYSNKDSYMGAKWIHLPFKGNRFAMVFVLPTKKHRLSQLIEKLRDEDLEEIFTSRAVSQVKLRIPKFKLSEKVSLVETMQGLGLTDVFTSASDLSGMTPGGGLQVSEMIHEANVEVDEKGSTASAATVLTLARMGIPNLSFVADQPFLFFIVDTETNIPLFAGKVINPKS